MGTLTEGQWRCQLAAVRCVPERATHCSAQRADLLHDAGTISTSAASSGPIQWPFRQRAVAATRLDHRHGNGLWYGFGMSQRSLRERANSGAAVRRRASHIPTTGPHPVPGGEYDRDGFLYRCPVENLRHELIRVGLAAVLRPHMRRHHGEKALVASDCGLYAKRADRFATPLAPDLLVSLTAGSVGAPGTPPEEDRMSYKLWQEPVPDLVLEIVSKSSGERDTVDKPNRYEAIGITEYWILDPHRHRIAEGLAGRLLVDGRYRDAVPRAPSPDEEPLPPGKAGYWSEVLGLYLYADGLDIELHDPLSGRVKKVEEEIAARLAAERARDAERRAREAAEARLEALEAELRLLRQP